MGSETQDRAALVPARAPHTGRARARQVLLRGQRADTRSGPEGEEPLPSARSAWSPSGRHTRRGGFCQERGGRTIRHSEDAARAHRSPRPTIHLKGPQERPAGSPSRVSVSGKAGVLGAPQLRWRCAPFAPQPGGDTVRIPTAEAPHPIPSDTDPPLSVQGSAALRPAGCLLT